ncbi:MAG: sodium:solute symporter family transporter, partial [Burkholderiaceae bacterium]
MTTLTVFVTLYLAVSVAIGLFAARRVKTSGDYAVAGRSLPLYIVIATVFATWFGSETVLGIPAKFVKDGLHGVIEDPFGASMCLVLVGLFFARKLYRMNLLTIGDYYRQRYSRTVEVLVSLCIVASYLGWVSAQIPALGLVFNVLSQ